MQRLQKVLLLNQQLHARIRVPSTRGTVSLGFLLACGLTTTALAQEPVTFDSRPLFSCAEVKPPQQADAARKVVVIVIPISANFNANESTVENLHYEFRFPKSVTVLDHYPKTQTGTDLAGLTQEQREEHQLTDLNVKFSGGRTGRFQHLRDRRQHRWRCRAQEARV